MIGGAVAWVAPAIFISLAVVLYFAFDRRRYLGRGSSRARPTQEVFRDPKSGKLMRVWEDPGTGEREYREED